MLCLRVRAVVATAAACIAWGFAPAPMRMLSLFGPVLSSSLSVPRSWLYHGGLAVLLCYIVAHAWLCAALQGRTGVDVAAVTGCLTIYIFRFNSWPRMYMNRYIEGLTYVYFKTVQVALSTA